MNNFIYDIPTKVYFGENQLGFLGEEVARLGQRVLLTYGGGSIKKSGLYDKVMAELQSAGLLVFEMGGIEPNPKIDSVRQGGAICKAEKIDVLLAVGGGSTIDCTKYIGAAAYYEGDPWDFLTGKANATKCLPMITILTLSATGSEMDRGGVISNPETQDKIGRFYAPMLPKVSFLNPCNTYTVSPYQTACGSADIMSHIMEVYFDMENDLFMLDCFMEGLLKTVIRYAPIAMREPNNYEARANLMWASSWAINGFINGGKTQEWSCHPMEHEVSAIYDITHGLGLAILTPRWLEFCLDESTVDKYYQFGVNVFDIEKTLPKMQVAKMSIEKLSIFFFDTLGMQHSFGELGIDSNNFAIMAKKACNNHVLAGFKPLKQKDIEKIFTKCL